ncbi:uncharacterized protein hemgn [Acanthochromis polyacanthus]|uniref:uncharacterized protein hemgn n=1 Tax=Acanthochromis polyacanthus TaxID=80966 RepID=UPI002234EA28|nr:uncharacterized protein hemgn [Acanthochromis polyacanthus]
MEETSQQEKPESEYIKPNEEEQGGIRRRLRDRDLLKKRKAEAEEKDQWIFGVESQRKRSRAEDKSGTKRRGRPRKAEPSPQISVIQEEAAVTQEAPAVVVVPEPAEVIPDQISASLTPLIAVETQSVSVLHAPAAPVSPAVPVVPDPVALAAPVTLAVSIVPDPAPVFQSLPIFGPPLTSPAPVSPALDLDPVSVQASAPAPDADSVLALSQDTVPPVAPPSAPPQVETLYKESQDKEVLNQVLIEDLGPDEEEDISTLQDKRADEDLSETLSTTINVPEQNKCTLFQPCRPHHCHENIFQEINCNFSQIHCSDIASVHNKSDYVLTVCHSLHLSIIFLQCAVC